MNWRFDRSVYMGIHNRQNLIDDLNTFSFNWFPDQWVMDINIYLNEDDFYKILIEI